MNFDDWYRENEALLVTQPFTNYVAAAAWKAAQAAERDRVARWLEWTEGGDSPKADEIREGSHWADGALEL